MKLNDFISLSSKVKLYKVGNSFGIPNGQIYTKSQVRQMIIDQIYDDLLSQVSKKEIKERIRNLIDKFEAVPPKKVIMRNISIVLKELKLI